jgi:hypothetical protein
VEGSGKQFDATWNSECGLHRALSASELRPLEWARRCHETQNVSSLIRTHLPFFFWNSKMEPPPSVGPITTPVQIVTKPGFSTVIESIGSSVYVETSHSISATSAAVRLPP